MFRIKLIQGNLLLSLLLEIRATYTRQLPLYDLLFGRNGFLIQGSFCIDTVPIFFTHLWVLTSLIFSSIKSMLMGFILLLLLRERVMKGVYGNA